MRCEGVDLDFYSRVPYVLQSERYRKSPHSLWGVMPSPFAKSKKYVHPVLSRDSSTAPKSHHLIDSLIVLDTDLRKQQEAEILTKTGNTHKLLGLHMISGVGLVDVDGDKKVEMITVDDGGGRKGGIRIYEIPADPTRPPRTGWQWRWVKNRTIHGLAIGDLNRDGRLDIAGDFRWYEQTRSGNWVEHAMPAPPVDEHNDRHKRGHLTMQSLIYDVDGNGDQDVIWTRAHNYGAFWMQSSGGKNPTFTLHEILPGQLPSTIHGPAFGDIDGDGDMDIFAGKCRYTHGDPGQKDPLDVFWLELVRSPRQVSWIKHQVATDLNMGFSPAVADIDRDGDMDLVMGAMGHARGIPPQPDVMIFVNNLFRKR